MRHVSLNHAAKLMAVSTATMRNWTKAGHISPVSSRPLQYSEEAVLTLKNKLGTTAFAKLNTRANKASSVSKFLPEEYADTTALAEHIRQLVSAMNALALSLDAVLYLAAIRALEAQSEVVLNIEGNFFSDASMHCWKRKCVKSAIAAWQKTIKIPSNIDAYTDFYKQINLVGQSDFLGLLYQAASKEGDKSEQGAYYTPPSLVENSLSQIKTPITSFLDPCCGSGSYLLVAARKLNLHPEEIYGFDCDEKAVHIAKLNLFLEYNDTEFTPNIFVMNSLTDLATGDFFCTTNDLIGSIDCIATNPPWGAYKNADSKLVVGTQIKSGETFSLFLERAIRLLKPGGQLSFILPEAFLHIKIHADIRELVLRETTVSTIALLGRQFSNVFTPVIMLDLVKRQTTSVSHVKVIHKTKTDVIAQERFSLNRDFIFDVSLHSGDEELLNKIYSIKHATLKDNAMWALGIVTGDNKKFIVTTNRNGEETLIRGSDISPYVINEPVSFIKFTPHLFQQVANENFFRAREKLIYKFISNRLVFAYDNKQRLSLNSANILIPNLVGHTVKTTMAFLNSSVFQYLHRKKFATHKILRSDLEQLPFPEINLDCQIQIEMLVDGVAHNSINVTKIDELVFTLFELSVIEIAEVKESIGKH